MGKSKRKKATASYAMRYTEWCISEKMVAWPPTYESVGEFLVEFVRQNQGSAKSINNITSALHVFCRYGNIPWMEPNDQFRLRKIVDMLHFQDTRPSKQKRPILLSMINDMSTSLDLSDTEDLLMATMMAVCHNALMRSGELLSGLRVKDIIWNEKHGSFTISLDRSKAHLKGPPELITVKDYPSSVSGYKLLKEWFDHNQLWDKPHLCLFPRRILPKRRGGTVTFDFQQSATIRWWAKAIVKQLTRLGFESEYYSGHSFRAGGATDLFVARVAYHTIKKQGRWKSDAALKYFRDELDIADTVAQAFGDSLSKRHRSQH